MQSTEISREDAALIIQSAYRRHRVLNPLTQQKRTLCEKIESVTGKIFTLTNRYQISLMHALEQSRMMTFTYIQKIENLNAITQRVAALYSKYVASKTGALGQLELIASQFEIEHACLRKLALNGGAASLSELLEFECGPNWREVIPSRALETISFYDSLFFPRETTQAIYSPYEKGGGEVVLLPDGEKIDYDEAELNEGKCLFTEPRIFSAATPQDHVCGAELCIPYEAEGRQRLLIVRGHFADDPTGLSSQVGPLFEKRQQVIEQLSDKDVPEPFKAGWLAHYALQGWSMKSAETIVRETCEAYADAKTLQTYSSRRIISDIQKCAYPVRREIVLQLLLAQDPALGLQVMEQLKDKAPDAYYDLFLHMPIQAQLYFDDARCTLEDRWSALNKAVSGPVDLQKQIKHSSMPDSAKQQALEKQEMLKKSVSGEAKAEEYLKRLLRFPWGKFKELPVTLSSSSNAISEFRKSSRAALDAAVLGQDKAKELVHGVTGRWISTGKASGVCLGFEGSPGVGKTELAMAIARAWGMPVVYISCGGLTDGSFLKGHGYTYEGSQPGRIVAGLTSEGYQNALFIIDEVDKLSDTPKGQEIAEALLELTDPNRNGRWEDSYFQGVPFPLNRSGIIMIYNEKNLIPKALWSRITNVKFEDLKDEEKREIARKYMLPKVAEACGFKKHELELSDAAIEHIIKDYDPEPGVRKLEQRLLLVGTEVNNIRLDDRDNFPPRFLITKQFAKAALDKTWSRENETPSASQRMMYL